MLILLEVYFGVVCLKYRLKKCKIPPEATHPRLERVSFTEILTSSGGGVFLQP